MVDIVPADTDAILESRIPAFKGNDEKKVSYLSYRAAGFSVKESLHLAEVKSSSLRSWRANDTAFRDFERDGKMLRELKGTAAKDVLEGEFKRNMLMLLRKDARIIGKSMQVYPVAGQGNVDGLEILTDREYEYLKAIRKFYTPDQLLQLAKALEPDKYNDSKIVLLSFSGRPVELPSPDDYGITVEIIDGDND